LAGSYLRRRSPPLPLRHDRALVFIALGRRLTRQRLLDATAGPADRAWEEVSSKEADHVVVAVAVVAAVVGMERSWC
jgi:hypothetical protein